MTTLRRARPVAVAVARIATLLLVATLLVFVLLPAVLAAAGPQGPIGG